MRPAAALRACDDAPILWAMVDRAPYPRVVIIGAGFAGLSAAQGLAGLPAEVILIDRHNYHLFQPLLYQVATAALSPAQIAYPIRAVLKHQRNCTVALGEVVGIDVANGAVKGHRRRIRFDYLVIATGSSNSYFGHPDWERFAPGLKSIDDATTIRRRILSAFERAEVSDDREEIQALLTFAVVGGGPTGVEMAGSIAELARHTLKDDFKRIQPARARIVLVEAGPRVLPSFPARLSVAARRDLQDMGVEVVTGTPVSDCTSDGIRIGPAFMPCRTVIWAAGIRASGAAEWLGVPMDGTGRAIVEPDLSAPGLSNVFVIGDTAACAGPAGEFLPGIAPVAKQQGRYVADVIRAKILGEPAPGPFAYRDYGTMAAIGRGRAVVNLRHLRFSGVPAWVMWAVIHILPLIGFRNRVVVAADWLWSYLTGKREARLITAGNSRVTDL